MRAIGLMSGTSMDGIDVALIETDGERVTRFGPNAVHAYRAGEEAVLRRAIEAAHALRRRDERPGILGEAEKIITTLHAAAVRTFLEANAIDRARIDVVGFHGQTILHRPGQRLTIQLGDGSTLAREIGLPVVYDFRAADVAAGGEGAPLVPVFHRALVRDLKRPHPVAVLNIGGVANITYVDDEADLMACDTGPGNALIDDFVRERTGRDQDTDGAIAARGKVDVAAVGRILAHPFFAKAPPKSLDRNDFHEWVASRAALEAKSTEDGAATLTALTAASVARIVALLPRPPLTFIVAGGGAYNPTLMRMVAEHLAPARVETAGEVGWSIAALEAQAFAFLAVRSLRELPLTFPGTTGVDRAMSGGVLARP